VLEKTVRPIIVYFLLILLLRLAGKRELAQLNTFDFVVLLMISNIIQNAIIGNDNSITGGIIGAVSLVVLNFVVAKFLFKHQKIDTIIEGGTDILIDQGIINERLLKKESITRRELESAAHKQGIANLDEIERAELDSDGEIFFIAKKPPLEDLRHTELLQAIEVLRRELREVTGELLKR
jgi:uncharacterized membrane protein YcaP (DUF421 family)